MYTPTCPVCGNSSRCSGVLSLEARAQKQLCCWEKSGPQTFLPFVLELEREMHRRWGEWSTFLGEMRTYIPGQKYQTGSLCSPFHVLGARGYNETGRPEWSSMKSSLKWYETVLCLFGGYSFNFTWLFWAPYLTFIKAKLGTITYKLTASINIQRGSLLALFHMVSHSLLTTCLSPQKCYLASMLGTSR